MKKVNKNLKETYLEVAKYLLVFLPIIITTTTTISPPKNPQNLPTSSIPAYLQPITD